MKAIVLLNSSAFEKLPEMMRENCIYHSEGEFYAMYTENIDDEDFNSNLDKEFVLVKRLAFSVNYRDKTLISNRLSISENSFFFFGSDFCAEVLEVGTAVLNYKVGDIVIGNNAYNLNEIMQQGIPSSNCSKEIEKIHHSKLLKINSTFSIEDAAVFSINGQTAYNVYRNLGFPEGKNILITSGRSQVSLFLLQLLSRKNTITVISSGEEKLFDLFPGLKFRILLKESEAYTDMLQCRELYDVIFDPFINQNLHNLLFLLKFSGSYCYCGYNPHLEEECKISIHMFSHMIKNKINLLAQCLGETIDLKHAVDDYQNKRIIALRSQSYKADNLKEFLEDTWAHTSGIGRPVFKF